MPYVPGVTPDGTLILGLTVQNYNLLMAASGIFCAFLIGIIWARGL